MQTMTIHLRPSWSNEKKKIYKYGNRGLINIAINNCLITSTLNY
jgi:hypothetical protein